jgi:hypothetical protein
MFKAIGSLFVYKSPKPRDGYKRFLRYLTSRQLGELAGTKTHYAKTELIRRIMSQ